MSKSIQDIIIGAVMKEAEFMMLIMAVVFIWLFVLSTWLVGWSIDLIFPNTMLMITFVLLEIGFCVFWDNFVKAWKIREQSC